jgi:hypothetical protein
MRHDGDEACSAPTRPSSSSHLYAGDWPSDRAIVRSGPPLGGASSGVEGRRPETRISESAAEFLDEPVLTCRATGTTVVLKEHSAAH